MFSLVSQKVMPQPPSANKKKQYEIHEVLGTGSFGKVMVRARAPIGRVYALKNRYRCYHGSARHGTYHPNCGTPSSVAPLPPALQRSPPPPPSPPPLPPFPPPRGRRRRRKRSTSRARSR